MALSYPPAYTSSRLLYVAFRAAFLTTFQALLDEFDTDHPPRAASGFLAQAPMATGCAPQVQLEFLLRTWHRIAAGRDTLTPLEQCISFYAIGELAKLGEDHEQQIIDKAAEGPTAVDLTDRTWLASSLRTIQITWPFPVEDFDLQRDGTSMMADAVRAAEIERTRPLADHLLEMVGDWTVSTDILSNADGLLTADEIRELAAFFSRHPQLMNL